MLKTYCRQLERKTAGLVRETGCINALNLTQNFSGVDNDVLTFHISFTGTQSLVP